MRTTFTVFLVLILAAVVTAQPGPPPRDGADRWDKDRVESVIIGKFATELELTPEQSEKFFPRFRTFREGIEKIHLDQRGLEQQMMELGQGGNGGQELLNQLLQQQQSALGQISGLKSQFLNDVSTFLNPAQTARCAILLDEVPRRIREMIEDRQQGGGDRPDHQRGGAMGRGRRGRGY